jgi:hypothetical protein
MTSRTHPIDEKGVHWSAHRCRAPHFERARRITRTAIERGELVRPETCERCGKKPAPMKDGRSAIQVHHLDYSNPLEVQWLCYQCHRDETPKPCGEKSKWSKITWPLVDEMRRRHANGESNPSIARSFGLDRGTVYRITSGKTWPEHERPDRRIS